MQTVYRMRAFQGLELTSWGNTGQLFVGVEPETLGVQPTTPTAIQTLSMTPKI